MQGFTNAAFAPVASNGIAVDVLLVAALIAFEILAVRKGYKKRKANAPVKAIEAPSEQ